MNIIIIIYETKKVSDIYAKYPASVIRMDSGNLH